MADDVTLVIEDVQALADELARLAGHPEVVAAVDVGVKMAELMAPEVKDLMRLLFHHVQPPHTAGTGA